MAATSLNTGRGRFALLQSCDGVADRDESPVARAGETEVMRGPMGVAGTTVVMAARHCGVGHHVGTNLQPTCHS